MWGLSNGLGILLARAISTQTQDHVPNVAASLPARKRAPSSAPTELLRLDTYQRRVPALQQFPVMRLRLISEHFLKYRECLRKRDRRDTTQVPYEPTTVNSAELIEDDKPVLLLKAASDTERVGVTTGRHRRDDECAQVAVQLVR